MATWNRLVSGSTAGNVSLNIDYAVTSVTRTSNTNVKVTYGIRFSMATSTYTYNSIAAFCPAGGTRYYAFNHSSGHTNKGTYYYANTSGSTTTSETCPFTQNITVSITQTSASFEVGYGWDAYQPSQKGKSSISVSFPTGATAPTGLSCSVSGTTETSCTLSGSYSSNGNATVTATGYQYKTEGGSWTNCTSKPSLSPNTKYYFRYYATNSQGTSYSGECNTTTYDYPKPTSINDFTIGNGATVNLYNPLGRNCTLDIISNVNNQVIGTYSGTYAGDVNGEFKTADAINKQYASIPNQQSGTYYARVTYGSSVKTLGNKTYSIKGDEKPTFNNSNVINVIDTLLVDTITGNNLKIIKGHNKITGNISKMTANYSSNGSRYVITANASPSSQELSYDSGATKSFTLENLTSNSFGITAYDSRGLSTAITKNIDLIDYNIPKINSFAITRQNGIGEYAIISASGTYSNWNGWNEMKKYNSIQKAYMRYKASNQTNYSNWKEITSGINRNESGNWNIDLTLDDVFTNTLKYDFQIYVQDLLESSVVSQNTLSTANGFLWRDLKNKRLGINKKPDYELDVDGTIQGKRILGLFSSYDTRNNNPLPSHYLQLGRGIHNEFKASSSNGCGLGNFVNSLTITPWGDSSGGLPVQIACNTAGFKYRMASSEDAWGSWYNFGLLAYPVGSIYMSVNATNPQTLFGGTWVQLKNAFLFATNSTSGTKGTGSGTGTSTGTNNGNTGSTTLTENQLPIIEGNAVGVATYSSSASGHFTASKENPMTIGSGSNNHWSTLKYKFGGGKGHTHNLGNHSHTVPYLEVYVWKRTA